MKTMKRLLAIVLVLVLALSLVACGDGKKDSGSSPSPSASSSGGAENSDGSGTAQTADATPNMNADGTPNLDKIGHFDANYDYSANEKFSFSYLAYNADILYQQSADAYEHWCTKYNLQWDGFVSANNDADMFMTNLQTALDQGTQMLVLDPDITMFPAIVDILKGYPDVVWMSQMGTPRSGTAADGDMYTCFVGFDYYGAGVLCAEKLVEWKEKNLPDVPWSDFGFASMTLSVSPPLYQREMGAKSVFLGLDGVKEEQYFTVDVITYGLTVQGAIDGFTPVISTNDQYKYWLVFGLIDDLAMGCATVIEQAGLTETSCIDCIGGPGLQTQLDKNQHTAFRYAYATPNLLYSEPILGALYAFKMGWATPDTIWPSWVKASDHGGEGHSYANLLLPSYWIDETNYQQFYAWTDLYSGCDYYGYDVDVSIDDFTPFVDVPAGWTD